MNGGPTIAIIPCTSQKADDPGPAREVWIGAHFQLVLAHTEMFFDEVYVLSFKYGLISPDFRIEPYNLDIRMARISDRLKWWFMVRQNIIDLCKEKQPSLVGMYIGSFERDRMIREFVKNGVKNVIIPFEGKGIGERQAAVYDCEAPYERELIATGEYEVKTDTSGKVQNSKYLPPPSKITEEIEWED